MRNDAWGAVSELAAAQHGAFTRRQAAHAGISKDVIRRLIGLGQLAEPRSGVLVVRAAPPSWEQRLVVPTLARPDVYAGFRSAARLHRLGAFGAEPTIEVATTRRFRSPGCVVHEVASLDPRLDVVAVDGIPTTGIARTLCDLGTVVSPDVVEGALDTARRRGISLTWVRQTLDRVHRPGQHGTGVLRALLDGIDPDEEVRGSWFEKVVEMVLASGEFPPIRRQHRLVDGAGRHVARFDLAMPSIRLGIEAHSREFHFGRAAEAADEDRDHRVAACGWDTVYLGYMSTRRPSETVELMREIVAARARLVLGADSVRSSVVTAAPAAEVANFP